MSTRKSEMSGRRSTTGGGSAPSGKGPGRKSEGRLGLAELLSLQRASRTVVPLLAVFTGLVIGALIIIFTDAQVLESLKNLGQNPLGFFPAAWESIRVAYAALYDGSVGSLASLSESLVASTPYIFLSLAVAVGFRAGLFNIGAEGQFFMGAIGSVWVGYTLQSLPMFIHLPLAVVVGALAGGVWAAIAGYLKARTGAHEVVVTIMLNYIAFRLSDWLLNGPMKRPGPGGIEGFVPITPEIEATAILPRLLGPDLRLHAGFILAILAAVLLYYLLFRTSFGFEMRSVGTNPRAAKVAGISVPRTYVTVMLLSGSLAGLAGASEVLGVNYWLGQGFSAGFGFDSIALALLGKSHPLGVVAAALLFGFLRAGATRMQSAAGIPVDIITVVQALVIVFVAAEALVRGIYRIRGGPAQRNEVFTRGWGS